MMQQTSFIAIVAAALVFTGAVDALPPRIGTVTTDTSGTYSIKQVRNTNHKGHNGPLSLVKAYMKYGAKIPDDLHSAVTRIRNSHAAAPRATGSAVTTPASGDVEYLTPVKIGTPAQTLNLDFDTGSSDLWVYSSETPKSSVKGQEIYTPSKSSTSSLIQGASWNISYGDGSSSSGDVYTDVVSVGGLSVQKQAVESAKAVSAQFTADTDVDGLLGLAFSSINTVSPKQQTTFFDTAKSSLTKKVFTADLKAGAPGTYNFGFIDDSLHTGEIAYVPVDNSQGFWSFTIDSYSVGAAQASSGSQGGNSTGSGSGDGNGDGGDGDGGDGGDGDGGDGDGGFFDDVADAINDVVSDIHLRAPAKATGSFSGIADTGTTLMLLDDAIVTAYYKQVSGAKYDNTQGGYVFACSAATPDFNMVIGGTTITVPGKYVNFAPVDSSNTSCFGGIQSDSGIGFSIIGDVGLKAAFVVFDGGNTQLGWATKTLS